MRDTCGSIGQYVAGIGLDEEVVGALWDELLEG